jgi:alpha-mannosidase
MSVNETYHQGELEQTFKGVEIDNKNIILSAMKQAEADDSVIIRLYETSGENNRANIRLNWLRADFETDFKPSEIKTFKIKSDGNILECNIFEENC